MSAYLKGLMAEREVESRLGALGYWVVHSPGSRSPADVVAVAGCGPSAPVLLVQVKAGKAAGLSSAEWNRLFSLARSHHAVPVLARLADADPQMRWYRLDRLDRLRRPGHQGDRRPWTIFDPALLAPDQRVTKAQVAPELLARLMTLPIARWAW